MAYMTLLAECLRCHRMFESNPYKVPTIRVDGVKEPLCLNCLNQLNVIRKELGLEEWVPVAGAYEPYDEDEIENFYED